MNNWGALGIQMVWFAGDARRENAANYFKAVFGTDPDSYQVNRTPTLTAPHHSVASGVFDGIMYQVTVQSSRVDLVAQREPTEDLALPPRITDVATTASELVEKASLLGDALQSVTRLALIYQLVQPADDQLEANAMVIRAASLSVPRSDVTDLSFQVNLRKEHDLTTLNRFLRFNVAAFQSVMVGLGGQQFSQQSTETFAANFSIDVNTVPQFQPLSLDQQKLIWNLIVEEANRLMSVGSVGGLW